MPDGSRPPASTIHLPAALVSAAVRAFDVGPGHGYVAASVAWVMFLRRDPLADPEQVARHYDLWCFVEAYYAGFNRLVGALGLRDGGRVE